MRRAEGGAKIVGVFRVKNHDFTPKNLIFSNFRGGGRRERLPLDPSLRKIKACDILLLTMRSLSVTECRRILSKPSNYKLQKLYNNTPSKAIVNAASNITYRPLYFNNLTHFWDKVDIVYVMYFSDVTLL